MKQRSIILMLILGTLVGLTQACSRPLPPETPCNFVQNPERQRVSWNEHVPVKLYIHSSVPVEAYPAIDRAIAEYKLKLGRDVFEIVARGTSGDTKPAKDGYSTIYWMDKWEDGRHNEQARTTIYWTGTEIFEADMRINADHMDYYFGEETDFSDVDLESLVIHELGHVLGLDHNVSSGSVMNFTLADGQDRREMKAVDLNNLKCEY